MMKQNKDIPLEPYYASDRRCYYGCPSSDLQREWDRTDALEKLMKELEPSSIITYFPVERKWEVATKPKYHSLTNNAHICKQQALIEAIKVFQRRKEEASIEQKLREEEVLFQPSR